MQTEHHMDRMGEERGHFVIAETRADQPFHVRIVGGNGERVLFGENLTDEWTAEAVVLMVARMFGAPDPVIAKSGETGRAVVLGARRAVDVRYVDERTVWDPADESDGVVGS